MSISQSNLPSHVHSVGYSGYSGFSGISGYSGYSGYSDGYIGYSAPKNISKKLEPKIYEIPTMAKLDPNFEKSVLGFFIFFHKLFKTKKHQELHKKLW